jgi:uncharacterized protein
MCQPRCTGRSLCCTGRGSRSGLFLYEHLARVLPGYGEADRAKLATLPSALEDAVRGRTPRATAQQVVDRFADRRPWFPLAWVPRDLLNHPCAWDDLDYDPTPIIARVTCPALLFYGESDEWTPADDSIAVWQRAVGAADLTVHRLPGCTHLPTLAGDTEVSPDYTGTLLSWLDERLRTRGT